MPGVTDVMGPELDICMRECFGRRKKAPILADVRRASQTDKVSLNEIVRGFLGQTKSGDQSCQVVRITAGDLQEATLGRGLRRYR